MCGPHSAIGLDEAERELWPQIRERLREPGHLMALMRGVLGGDVEVAAAVAVTPQGVARPLALLATPGIAAEIHLTDSSDGAGVRPGRIGDYDIEVLVGPAEPGQVRPLAVLVSPWIFEHLALYARKLWSRR